MKQSIKIGTTEECRIPIRSKHCPKVCAEITYQRSIWVIESFVGSKDIIVNSKPLLEPRILEKYDVIKAYRKVIYWSDYLYEGEEQVLEMRDFTSLHGRISRANFRALSLLALGAAICVYFLPGLIIGLLHALFHRSSIASELSYTESIQFITPPIHFVGYTLLALFYVLLSIKRWRDTGQKMWKIMIPFYNLWGLYFRPSRKI